MAHKARFASEFNREHGTGGGERERERERKNGRYKENEKNGGAYLISCVRNVTVFVGLVMLHYGGKTSTN